MECSFLVSGSIRLPRHHCGFPYSSQPPDHRVLGNERPNPLIVSIVVATAILVDCIEFKPQQRHNIFFRYTFFLLHVAIPASTPDVVASGVDVVNNKASCSSIPIPTCQRWMRKLRFRFLQWIQALVHELPFAFGIGTP